MTCASRELGGEGRQGLLLTEATAGIMLPIVRRRGAIILAMSLLLAPSGRASETRTNPLLEALNKGKARPRSSPAAAEAPPCRTAAVSTCPGPLREGWHLFPEAQRLAAQWSADVCLERLGIGVSYADRPGGKGDTIHYYFYSPENGIHDGYWVTTVVSGGKRHAASGLWIDKAEPLAGRVITRAVGGGSKIPAPIGSTDICSLIDSHEAVRIALQIGFLHQPFTDRVELEFEVINQNWSKYSWVHFQFLQGTPVWVILANRKRLFINAATGGPILTTSTIPGNLGENPAWLDRDLERAFRRVSHDGDDRRRPSLKPLNRP